MVCLPYVQIYIFCTEIIFKKIVNYETFQKLFKTKTIFFALVRDQTIHINLCLYLLHDHDRMILLNPRFRIVNAVKSCVVIDCNLTTIAGTDFKISSL